MYKITSRYINKKANCIKMYINIYIYWVRRMSGNKSRQFTQAYENNQLSTCLKISLGRVITQHQIKSHVIKAIFFMTYFKIYKTRKCVHAVPFCFTSLLIKYEQTLNFKPTGHIQCTDCPCEQSRPLYDTKSFLNY